MEDYFAERFEKMWLEHRSLFLELDFKFVFKILSSEKLKSQDQSVIWQAMHDWMNFDTVNRLTHFKKLIYKCLQVDHLNAKFAKNNIFQSYIFKLLPVQFQQELINLVIKDEKFLFCINRLNRSIKNYNLLQNNWEKFSLQFPTEQNEFQAALLGNTLFIIGGLDEHLMLTNQVWSHNLSHPSASQWIVKAPMNQKRKDFSSVALNETIYVFSGRGGTVDNSNKYYSLSSCERYDSQLDQWFAIAPLFNARQYASAAALNGLIYVAGGVSGWGIEASLEQYDPQTGKWKLMADMLTSRSHFALTPFAGRLWAIGGNGEDSSLMMASVESYDPQTNSWQQEASLSEGRLGHAAIDYYGELYVVGGKRAYDPVIVVEKYVPDRGWINDGTILLDKGELQLLLAPLADKSLLNITQN